MNESYEYRRFKVAPGEWERFAERLRGEGEQIAREYAGSLFGVWRGQIGLEANEGIALTAWPDEEALASGATALHGLFAAALESRAERLVATLRPEEPSPPQRVGVYAFRFFSILDRDWAEFADLSARAWPGFEAGYDTHICGFFRSLDVRPPDARVLLLTRYASLAAWEASRADVGRAEFQRRQKLTRATIVCTAVPG
ncbi:MAG: NIPSNAP family protein [bacterium]